jgi:release factor glutamine methyltransferase
MTSSHHRTTSEPWTIRRLVLWATEDFRRRGFDSPRLDADLLLGHVLGKTRIEVILDGERPLDRAELDRFRELARRRRAGEPTAYLIGRREFYGTPLLVDQNVLIPRPDTEILVAVALERTGADSATGAALDLCTGSGCVAIALALARRGWTMTGIDLSAPAIEVARRNAVSVGLDSSIAFEVGDLFVPLQSGAEFDLITANPPYIPTDVIPTLEIGIRDFEPRLALDGGPDGLQVTRRMIDAAPARLAKDGILAIEIGYDQGAAVTELMQAAGFIDVLVAKDYGGNDRVVSGRKG